MIMKLHFIMLASLVGIFLTISCYGQESQSIFPLCRSMAGDRELPNPYGVGITYHHQKQDYDLVDLMVNLPGIDLAQASAAVTVDNTTDETNLKLDLWLLPFMNVFGIIGHVEGQTEVTLPQPLGSLDVDYDGLVYGGGLTLAGGYEKFFGSITAIFTNTDLDISTSSVEAFILTPRIGYCLGFGEVWIGSMYQHTQEEHSGTVSVPMIGTVNFDVELEEKDPWNYLAGVRFNLGKNWDLEIEGGVGERQHVTASLTYRF
jgi:hypothetical protein